MDANRVNRPRLVAGVAYGVGTGALWGLVFLAPRLVGDFGPLHLAVGRYLCFGAISAALLAPRWHAVVSLLSRGQWWGLVRLGLLGNLVYYVFLAAAVQRAGIAATSLVIGCLPVAVTLVGSRDQGAVPLRRLAVSLALCVAGTACIGWHALDGTSTGGGQWSGLLCALAALASWTCFAVSNTRQLARAGRIGAHDWNLLTGMVTGGRALLLIPVAALLDRGHHPLSDWMRLAGVALGMTLCCSIVGNAWWNQMSRLLPLTLVGQMILAETLFALVYGFLWERRLPDALEVAAFLLVAASVITCIWAHRREPMA